MTRTFEKGVRTSESCSDGQDVSMNIHFFLIGNFPNFVNFLKKILTVPTCDFFRTMSASVRNMSEFIFAWTEKICLFVTFSEPRDCCKLARNIVLMKIRILKSYVKDESFQILAPKFLFLKVKELQRKTSQPCKLLCFIPNMLFVDVNRKKC